MSANHRGSSLQPSGSNGPPTPSQDRHWSSTPSLLNVLQSAVTRAATFQTTARPSPTPNELAPPPVVVEGGSDMEPDEEEDNEHPNKGLDGDEVADSQESGGNSDDHPDDAGDSESAGLLTQLATALAVPGTEHFMGTLAQDLHGLPSREKDRLFAALLINIAYRQANPPPPSPAPSAIDSELAARLNAMNIRIHQLQVKVGFDTTDPLANPSIPPVASYGGGLPFGSGPSNPDMTTAFAGYGRGSTTMSSAPKVPQAPEQTPEEKAKKVADKLAKMQNQNL